MSASEGWDYAIGREMGNQKGGLKIFQEEYVHVFPISKTESVIKIRYSGRLVVHTECSHDGNMLFVNALGFRDR